MGPRKSDPRRSSASGSAAAAPPDEAAAELPPEAEAERASPTPAAAAPATPAAAAAATDRRDRDTKDREAVSIEVRPCRARVTRRYADDAPCDSPLQDLALPKSIITRLVKGILPTNTQVQANAMLAMSKSATVFINYLAAQ